MHYPVMTERQIAARWKVSLKTLRRWRRDGEGPVWHKLFHHVRYHEADVLEFERQGAQHWQTILGERERVPRVVTHPPKADGDDAQTPDAAEPDIQYVSAKDVALATQLPAYLFADRAERYRKHIPHLLLVGNVRYSLDAILEWELANSIRGRAKGLNLAPATPAPEPEPLPAARVPRWYELAGEQEEERFDSPQ